MMLFVLVHYGIKLKVVGIAEKIASLGIYDSPRRVNHKDIIMSFFLTNCVKNTF